jgi:hypothetical protein
MLRVSRKLNALRENLCTLPDKKLTTKCAEHTQRSLRWQINTASPTNLINYSTQSNPINSKIIKFAPKQRG